MAVAVSLDVKLPPQIISLDSTLALATAEHQRLGLKSFADELVHICTRTVINE